MAILYVHGVNVRSRAGFEEITPSLRRDLAPALSADPGNLPIRDAPTDASWG